MISITKIHTKAKRLLGVRTNLKHRFWFKASSKKRGKKTFTTEAAARKWAGKQGLEGYEVVPAKRGKRFQIQSR